MRKIKGLVLAVMALLAMPASYAQSEFDSYVTLGYEQLHELYNSENSVNYDSIVFSIDKNPRVYWLLKSFVANDVDPQWSQTVYRYVPIREVPANRPNGSDFWYSFPEVDKKNLPLAQPSTPARFKMNTRNSTSEGYYYNLAQVFLRLLNENKIVAYEHSVKKTEGLAQYTRFTHNQIMDVIAEKTNVDIPAGESRRVKEEDMEYVTNQIVGYEFQELWYFDDRTGEYRKRIVAFSPLILDSELNPYFLFTLSMEDLAPYLMLLYVQNSGRFNDFSMTYFSYFSKGLYEGPILRVPNVKGELLVDKIRTTAQGATADEMRAMWVQESARFEEIVAKLDGSKSWAIPSQIERMMEEKAKAGQGQQKTNK